MDKTARWPFLIFCSKTPASRISWKPLRPTKPIILHHHSVHCRENRNAANKTRKRLEKVPNDCQKRTKSHSNNYLLNPHIIGFRGEFSAMMLFWLCRLSTKPEKMSTLRATWRVRCLYSVVTVLVSLQSRIGWKRGICCVLCLVGFISINRESNEKFKNSFTTPVDV